MTELKPLDDRALYDNSCITRHQLATWTTGDFERHPDGVHKTIKTLIDWHDLATTALPLSEYHEDMGDVLWWKFPIEEPPYVGSPLDCGFEVLVDMTASIHTYPNKRVGKETHNQFSRMVGGWPGYHTHFTPIPMPKVPK